MRRIDRDRFERRFNRGFIATEAVSEDVGFIEVRCSVCCDVTMDYPDAREPKCFACSNADNPFAQKNIRMSVDATGEDSTDPIRLKDGTSHFNLALPAQDVEYGPRNAYGQRTVRRSRPVANNEIASARRLKELAKRSNLTPQDTQKRAIGGR